MVLSLSINFSSSDIPTTSLAWLINYETRIKWHLQYVIYPLTLESDGRAVRPYSLPFFSI